MYNILIVDDEYWMCKGIQKVVERYCLNFKIAHYAHNGKEALAYLKNTEIDVVITDIWMPKMTGLELVKEMRKLSMHNHVIIITGYNDFEYAQTAIRYGVEDYILKPLSNIEVKEALHRLEVKMEETVNSDMEDTLENENFSNGKVLIEHVLLRIHSSFKHDLSLTSIAEETGFNPSYLSRLFKYETGKSFVKYLNEVRLKEAQKLLEQSVYSISDIANHVGFWDDKYFSRFFKTTTARLTSGSIVPTLVPNLLGKYRDFD